MKDNIAILTELKEVYFNKVPESYLKTSSWNAVKDNIHIIEDSTIIALFHDLYFNMDWVNKSIDFLRQTIFQETGSLDMRGQRTYPKTFLANEIRTKTIDELIPACSEIIEHLSPEAHTQHSTHE